MKPQLLLLVFLLFAVSLFSQTVIFTETFEPPSGADSVISSGSPGYAPWSINSRIARSGIQSDSTFVTTSDTARLTTLSFNTLGNTSVFLYFSHICKIEFGDAAEILVSNDNGLTWNKLTASQYHGSGVFGSIADKFASTSYIDWQPAQSNALPDNSWWKDEIFDISAFAANSSAVRVMFRLRDGNSNGAVGNAGWYLDDIKVVMSPSELIPPSLTLVPPVWQDTTYMTGPYAITAHITDASGIDTAFVTYTVNNGVPVMLGMQQIAPDTFRAVIPFPGFGRTIHYRVTAVDGSAAGNTAHFPYASAWNMFFVKFATGGTYVIGTDSTYNMNTDYPAPYGNWFWGAKHQFLIRASELFSLGAPGGAIGSLAFHVRNPEGTPLQGFTIKIGHTALDSMSSSFAANLTTVYTSTSYTETAGWNTHTFQTPFQWNGSNNLIVETCFNNTSYTYNAQTYHTATPFLSGLVYYDDDAGVCATSSAFWNINERPNMKIEILGVNAVAVDAGIGQLIHPTGGVTAGQAFNVQVRLKNFGTDTLNSVQVQWELNGNPQQAYSFSGTLLPDSMSPIITLGSLTLPVGIHQLKIWTNNPNNSPDMNSANDTVKLSFYGCASQLSGTYTIGGSGADFATLGAAITALVQCGIIGPVVFNIAGGVYNEQITMPLISGSGPLNTVLFKSLAGDSNSVVLRYNANASDNYTLKFQSAKYCEFRQITIEAADSTFARAVVLSGKPEYVTLKGLVLKNIVDTNSIFAHDDKANLLHTADSVAGFITIDGCRFVNGNLGVQLAGNSFNHAVGIVLTNNVFVNQIRGGMWGVSLGAPQIKGNALSTHSSKEFSGFSLANISGGGTIEKNRVNIPLSSFSAALALNKVSGSQAIPLRVTNNFFRSNSFAAGLSINGAVRMKECHYLDFVFNSLNITGNSNNSAVIHLDDAAALLSHSLSFINNNLINNANGYVYCFSNTDSLAFSSNYNNQRTTGTVFSRYNGFNQGNQAAWRTKTGADSNSLSLDPYYTSASDLHTGNNLLNATATPLAYVADDIDGDLRHATTPDIGADEFVPSLWDAALIEIVSPLTGCGLDTAEAVSIRIKNAGSSAISGNLTASFKLDSHAVVSHAVTASIPAGDTLLFTFANTVNLDVFALAQDSSYEFIAWVDLLNDPVKANDTLKWQVISQYQPLSPVVQDTTISYATPVTLNALSNASVNWYSASSGGNHLQKGNTYTTPVLYTTTTYWVEASHAVGSSGAFTIGTGTVTNSTTGYPAPYGHFYNGARHQMLITAAELQALGFTGGSINSLAFDVAQANGSQLMGFEIKLGHTGQPALLPNAWLSGLTSVYYAASYTDVNGWNTHAFTTPFVWNGFDNLVVETCFDNFPNGYTYNAEMNQSMTNFVSTVWENSDLGGVCTGLSPFGSANQRPNIQITAGGAGDGCVSPRVPLVVTVGNPAPLDAGVYQIVSPSSGVNLGTQETVKVRVRNYGTNTLTILPVSFSVNNQAAVTENITATLASQDTLEYSFVAKANLSVTGSAYLVKVWTGLAGDQTSLNDTAFKTVSNQLPTYCISTADDPGYEEIVNVTLHTLDNNSPASGSVYTNFSALVAPPMLSPGVSYPISVSSGYAPGNSNQYPCHVKVWIDFNRDGTFDPAGEMIFSSATTSAGKVSGQANIPATASIGLTMMRVVFVETFDPSDVQPCGIYFWGETEDYAVMIAPQAPCDAGVMAVSALPGVTTAGASVSPVVRFMNYGSQPIAPNTLSIAYKINNGNPMVVNYSKTLPPLGVDSVQMPAFAVMMGENIICAYTILACDSSTFNNEVCRSVFGQSQAPLPYADGFDGPGLWFGGNSGVWQRGMPAGTSITTVKSLPNAWMTVLAGNYPNNANAPLLSPIFDFSMLNPTDTALLSFWHSMHTEMSDAGNLEYSVNGGVNWANLGYIGDPLSSNWYNTNIGGTHAWAGILPWTQSSYKLDPAVFNASSQVQFRLRFFSNAFMNNYDGWAIDDFSIAIPPIPNDVGVLAMTSPAAPTQVGSTVTVEVLLKNYGTQPQTAFNVGYRVKNGAVVTAPFSGNLAPGATQNFSFPTSFVSPTGPYKLQVFTSLTGDYYLQNDTLTSFVLSSPAPNDAGISRILHPRLDTTYSPLVPIEVSVMLRNFGSNTLTSLPVTYSVSGQPKANETWTGSLGPNDSVAYTFTTLFYKPLGYYQVCASTQLAGDADPANDQICLMLPPVGIEESGLVNGIRLRVSPNPASETVLLECLLPVAGDVDILLQNTLGQIALKAKKRFDAGSNSVSIDISGVPAGIYFCTLIYDNRPYTVKLVIGR